MMGLWDKLSANQTANQDRSIASLFSDPYRLDRFSTQACDVFLDASKTNIDNAALDLLIGLVTEADVAGKRDAMFAGKKINDTEGRAVLHTALRANNSDPLNVDDEDVRPGIAETLNRMRQFCDDVRTGAITTPAGQRFTDVVNIGIGGSDLGPAMAVQALAPYHDGPKCHFVSNVDAAHIHDVVAALDPATTLIVIASKTFTTIETMTNARAAMMWLKAGVGAQTTGHLAAISSAVDKTAAMGIDPERVFGFEEWVGGRYSLWGPIGLAIMLAIGGDRFAEFLAGARDMDAHFQTAPLDQNLPVMLALTGLWHRNVCGYPTRAVLPYDQRLNRFPAYLQQLDMESNGKRVTLAGETLTIASGPVVWGEPGTNGQHAFYQLLHQGTDVIPAEFLIAAEGHEPDFQDHHELLKANCLAQSEALMLGRSATAAREIAGDLGFTGAEADRQAAHRTFPGNRPSVTIAYPKLTPRMLGTLIALYEHRVFVEGAVWGINSFDQWGVELGKELAKALLPMVRSGQAEGKDASTAGLVTFLKK
ncbi:glucose-6-phosphate isomerase [uncultured Shimia sp.]|uniref:glucose-6-phosphate isomerase n=1 Tax=uncultured Shimia sp. TaxID=573152 RepID=UPI002601C86F|nr:glucose-6-phosphate isomerase [uncultured Shimia sp.]